MTENQEKLGAFPFVLGGLSFIPLIGVLFGIVAIAWGLITKKDGGRKLAIIGGCGIAFSVVLYAGVFYLGFMQRGGSYDELRESLGKSTITGLVQSIEFYKATNGEYPESLVVLRDSLPKRSMVFIHDPTDVKFGGEGRLFHYELVDDDHYYLLGIGADGIAFTADDILPDIEPSEGIGLIIKKPSATDF